MRSNAPTVIITHHTGGTDTHPQADSSNATVNDVDQWHKARWPDFKSSIGYWVGYHFFIDKHGVVTQTRKFNEEGAHTFGMNTKSIGVCFAGNFDLTLPTAAQIKAWNDLYAKIEAVYPNIPTFPHRKYATKTCHGKLLSDDYFARLNQIQTLKQRIRQLQAQLQSLLLNKRFK